MEYVVVSHQFKKIAAEGEGVLVAFDYKLGKKDVFSQDLILKIREIEGKVSV